MNRWTILSLACLLLSVPLAWLVLRRDMGGGAVPFVRVATFNAALNRDAPGALLAELRAGSEQARRIAEIVQRCDVDVVLLCELDRDAAAAAADVFAEQYLARPQRGQRAIEFPFRFAAEVNTGEPSGLDLDGDGAADGPGDAWGFGRFPGQYGMAVLSRHPIARDRVRTFRTLRWSAMPGALRPAGLWDDATWQQLRLSSKSHWDVPIHVLGRDVHLLCSHPTPPVFDGPEDRNGCRNHDELRFWVDYLTPGRGDWIVDDAGVAGGFGGEHFVLLGDFNCDPIDGDARREALLQLLQHARVTDPLPTSAGAVVAATDQWGANSVQQGDPALDTGDFDDEPGKGPGNLRIDYALPSRDLVVLGAGVFWPAKHAPGRDLVDASDHRLVWVDVGYAAPN
ncbi:MAG: endonuclease/exonuclease/phosphatase family protein [Planctomycetota bacterium]